MAQAHNPPPLTAAASLVAIQGFVLASLAVVDAVNIVPERRSLGVSTSVFFGSYGLVLILCALALIRRAGWARGPVLITQLIALGLAWSLRDVPLVAVTLAVTALVVLAGLLHPDSIQALSDRTED